jgi:hypothetical protein
VKAERWDLPLALAALVCAAGPFLLGRGVDVPDDALHHSVANWEWLRTAWTHGLNPHWMPGKLGGIPLAADVVPMGPFYPASWLLFVFPVWIALPLAALAHAVGILFAVRWFAQAFGVGPRAATLAGAALAAGPLAAISFVDCHLDVLPIYLFFPLALGAAEKLARATQRRAELTWALLCGASLALLLLGSHIRFSAAACAAWGLWALMRRVPLHWIALATLLAVCGGAPGFLPNFLAAQEASTGLDRLLALASPVHENYNAGNLAGWLSPKPYWMNRDFSLGAVLGIGFLLGLPLLRGPIRRLAIFTLVLLAAALSPSIPGLRYLFAPLLLLTHPLDLIYGALALFPAAVVGARGLEHLVAVWPRPLHSRWTRAALFLLVSGLLIRSGLPQVSFGNLEEFRAWEIGLLQLACVVFALLWILRRKGHEASRLPTLLVLVALLDLVLLGLRFHLAVPAADLRLRERAQSSSVESLGSSYVDTLDLMELQGFLYDREELAEAPDESQAEAAASIRDSLEGRRWPLHIGPAHGLGVLSGRAKMPPQRSIGRLMPLAEALLRSQGDQRGGPERQNVLSPEALFAPDQMGGRILRLSGTEVAVDRSAVIGRVHDPLPRCWIPASHQLLEGDWKLAMMAAWDAVVGRGVDPLRRTFLESSLPGLSDVSAPSSDVAAHCDGDVIEVRAAAPTLVVLRQPYDRGWSIETEAGAALALGPANAFHSAFIAPAGGGVFQLSFVPEGLPLARALAAPSWLAMLAGLAFSWRRRSSARSARKSQG